MRTLILMLALLAATPNAWGQGRTDCAMLRKEVEALKSAAYKSMTTTALVAISVETGDTGLMRRVSSRMGDPLRLAMSNPEFGSEIIKATSAVLKATDQVLASAGCPAKPSGK